MGFELSPAAERVFDFAKQLANLRSATQPDLIEWLTALLDDEDGKPTELLPHSERFLVKLRNLPAESYPGALPERIFRIAAEHARKLRGDVQITTDLLLLAVLKSSFTLCEELSVHGVDVDELEEKILGKPKIQTDSPTSDETSPVLVIENSLERWQVARILDVNLNRARESLRILDDYSRFIANDRSMTQKIKQLRHELVQLIALLPEDLLISARDTLQDVGTAITTESEQQRGSASQVAEINMKRLQESLRSLEEFGKVLHVGFASQIEQIRYQTYTLEKLLLKWKHPRERLIDATLYLLVGSENCLHSLETVIFEAVQGGVDLIQLREKHATDRELLERAKLVRRWTTELGIPLIMNDRVDLALLVGADGVHLGQDDLPLALARGILGTQSILGKSTHDLDQLEQAILEGADYVGLGPTFPSHTKSFSSFAGLHFLQQAAQATTLPCFALGGIQITNLPEVLATGVRRIAVSAAITRSDEPKAVAMQLKTYLQNYRENNTLNNSGEIV